MEEELPFEEVPERPVNPGVPRIIVTKPTEPPPPQEPVLSEEERQQTTTIGDREQRGVNQRPLVFDDTPIKADGPSAFDLLRQQDEWHGVIPDDRSETIKPEPAFRHVDLSAMDIAERDDRTREEEEDRFNEPFQVAGIGPKFMKQFGKSIMPPQGGHLPPPPMGHNNPPPGMGLPPPGPPPPTSGVPLVPPPAGPPRQILHGVSDERPWDVHDLYTQGFDDLHPIKRLQARAEKIAPLTEEEHAYELARLTRGSYGRSHQALKNSTYDYATGADNGPGLAKVLAPVKGDLRGFEDYAVAMRDIELHGRGLDPGRSVADAQAVIANATPEMRQALRDLWGYQDRIMQYVKDSGLVSDEAYNAMKAANRHYVPFHREVSGDSGDLATSARNLKTWNPFKKIGSSDKDLLSPIESIVRNTHYLMDLAEKNRALNALVDMAGRRNMTGLVKPVRKGVHPLNVQRDEVEKFLNNNGVPVPGQFYGAPDSFTIFRPDALRPAQDEIVAYKNGVPHVFKVDKGVADAVNGMGHRQVGVITKLLSVPAKGLRAGATLTPDFMSKNAARDQLVAATLSRNGYLPVVDWMRGFGHMVGNTKKWQEFLKSGGANSAIVAMDRKYIEEEVRNMMESGLWHQLKNIKNHPLEALSKLSEYSEVPTRLGEYIKATDPGFIRSAFGAQGKDRFLAGYDAREVSVDFFRQGADEWVRRADQQAAFFNPQKQGLDRFVRAAKDDPTLGFKVAATALVPSLVFYYYNRQDPRTMDIPREERDLFWHIPQFDWKEITEKEAKEMPKAWIKKEGDKYFVNKAEPWKVPKHFEIGMIGTALERSLDAYFDKHPEAWKDFERTMITTLVPNPVPTWVRPTVEATTNFSLWRGRPIVSRRLETPVDRRYEYDQYTSETAKLIGSGMANIAPRWGVSSPKMIENQVYGWSGGLGRYALKVGDLAIKGGKTLTGAPEEGRIYKKWQGRQLTGKESMGEKIADWYNGTELSDYPVFRSWLQKMPSTYSSQVTDFYDNVRDATTTKATAKRLIGAEKHDAANELLRKAAMVKMQKASQAIGNQFKLIEQIQGATNIPAEDKKKLIDNLSLGIIRQATWANEIYHQNIGKTQVKKPTPGGGGNVNKDNP